MSAAPTPGRLDVGSTASVHRLEPFSGIAEQFLVVDARHRTDNAVVVVSHGDEIGDRIVVLLVVPDDVDGGGHHSAPHVDAIDRVGVLGRAQRPNAETGRRRRGLVILGEPQPVGMARIDEQLRGGKGDQDV